MRRDKFLHENFSQLKPFKEKIRRDETLSDEEVDKVIQILDKIMTRDLKDCKLKKLKYHIFFISAFISIIFGYIYLERSQMNSTLPLIAGGMLFIYFIYYSIKYPIDDDWFYLNRNQKFNVFYTLTKGINHDKQGKSA